MGEQNIVIKSSGGLLEEDIEKMVRDAESNAEADAKRRQLIEQKNEIDSLIYSTEKSLTDNGDKLDEETKKMVETAVKEAKEVKDSDDLDDITKKKDELSEASMKIGQAMYASQAKEGGEGGEEKKDDNDDTTQDAEFTEKKKDEGGSEDDKKDDKK